MAKIYNVLGDSTDPNIVSGLVNVNSGNVYPSTITAVASTGTAIPISYLSNYDHFRIAQTSASTDFVTIPDGAIGTQMTFYGISACSIKTVASSGIGINGQADTGSILVSAGELVRLTRVTSTNWVSETVAGGSPEGDGVTQFVEVSITNAEMLALRATPKTLVAAPGAGKVLEFISAILLFDYTGAYTETTDNMAVRYNNTTGVIVSQAIEATGFVDATADTMTNALAKIDAIASAAGSANLALVLHNTGDGEYGGGNAANVIRVKVNYRVWSTGF